MTIERIILRSCVVSLWMLTPVFAQATTVLDFDDLDNFDNVYTYYDGGFNDAGMQGPDFGIRASGGALAVRAFDNTFVSFDTNFSGSADFSVEDGFTNGFAMRYAAITGADTDLRVVIRDENMQILVNATVPLDGNPDAVDGLSWFTLGLDFVGEAHHVSVFDIGPVEGYFVAIDDLTFGQTTLVPVPGAVWLFGGALAGLAGLGKRRAES